MFLSPHTHPAPSLPSHGAALVLAAQLGPTQTALVFSWRRRPPPVAHRPSLLRTYAQTRGVLYVRRALVFPDRLVRLRTYALTYALIPVSESRALLLLPVAPFRRPFPLPLSVATFRCCRLSSGRTVDRTGVQCSYVRTYVYALPSSHLGASCVGSFIDAWEAFGIFTVTLAVFFDC